MLNESGFALLASELRKTLCAEFSFANINRAESAQKPSAVVARRQRTISGMKEANRLRSLRYFNLKAGGRIVLKRRKDERLHFRVARWAFESAPALSP